MKILCGCVIRSDKRTVERFLRSLERLRRSSFELKFTFVDDTRDGDLPYGLSYGFADVNVTPNEVNPSDYSVTDYTVEDYTYWCNNKHASTVGFKNRFLKEAREANVDYLFIVDDDMLFHPETLEQLVRDDKDIVSCFDSLDNCLGDLQVPEVRSSDNVKGATLISRRALWSGIAFDEMPGVSTHNNNSFSIRALAHGFKLYVDSNHPACVMSATERNVADEYFDRTSTPEQKLTLSMIVHNEANRYLDHVLAHASAYITDAVIIDDASTDNTLDVIARTLRNIPYKIVHNKTSKFANEVELRKQQWKETLATTPDWILSLDADEVFEDGFGYVVRDLINDHTVDAHSFRLFDMWDAVHYREDSLWNAHAVYRPFLVRAKYGITYEWHETAQHCGRQPINVDSFTQKKSEIRLKHLGWMRPDDRTLKYARYIKLDPKGKFGSLAQYESVFDAKPHLITF